MVDRLKDKIAVVTGAGSGIGKAIAVGFAREGADMVVVARTFANVQDTAREIEKLGRKALPLRIDVRKLSDLEKMADETIRFFGKIDILVNNAGIVYDLAILDVQESQWDDILNTDLKGAFFASQKALPAMLKQGSGKIINIASPLSIEGKPDCSIYCAAKGGILNLTRALAIELAPQHINVNAIAPGFTYSNMTKNFTSDPEKMKEIILPRIPLGRAGQPEDIVGAAVYLAANESDFVTGTTLFVDGGETAQ